MDEAKQKLLTRIQESNNVLVTVSNNPSLDQLAGAIGLTLLLNKLGKHATAVFSGKIPSSIEYLKPEQTLEKDTNSLRDFIIALDKAKADKLRYKVEDKVVKIFITPYRTSLTQDDLEFSQGDFNVDLVMALGVHDAKDLDQAITSHGRILHDATVSSINTATGNEMGTINWVDTQASSLCEMLYDLVKNLKGDSLDPQMATAFLTGIVAETKRFSNEKTSAKALDISGQLMAAGANQQLVAARLELPGNLSADDDDDSISLKGGNGKGGDDDKKGGGKGTLSIDHTLADIENDVAPDKAAKDQIEIDEKGNMHRVSDELPQPIDSSEASSPPDTTPAAQALPDVPPLLDDEDHDIKKFADKKAFKPPVLNSNLSAPQADLPDPTLEPAQGMSADTPVNAGIDNALPLPPPVTGLTEAKPDLNAARDAVTDAVNASPVDGPLPPRIDLNANPAVELSHDQAIQPPSPVPQAPTPPTPFMPPTPPMPPAPSPAISLLPPSASPAPVTNFPSSLIDAVPAPTDPSATNISQPLAPPPLPPPLMPADFGSMPQAQAPQMPQPPLAPQPPLPPQPPAPLPPQQ